MVYTEMFREDACCREVLTVEIRTLTDSGNQNSNPVGHHNGVFIQSPMLQIVAVLLLLFQDLWQYINNQVGVAADITSTLEVMVDDIDNGTHITCQVTGDQEHILIYKECKLLDQRWLHAHF